MMGYYLKTLCSSDGAAMVLLLVHEQQGCGVLDGVATPTRPTSSPVLLAIAVASSPRASPSLPPPPPLRASSRRRLLLPRVPRRRRLLLLAHLVIVAAAPAATATAGIWLRPARHARADRAIVPARHDRAPFVPCLCRGGGIALFTDRAL